MENEISILNEKYKIYFGIRNVKLKIEISRIGDLNSMNESFQACVILNSEWIETENISEYDPALHWNPEFYIENLLSDFKEENTYKIIKNNDVNTIRETKNLNGKNSKSRFVVL